MPESLYIDELPVVEIIEKVMKSLEESTVGSVSFHLKGFNSCYITSCKPMPVCEIYNNANFKNCIDTFKDKPYLRFDDFHIEAIENGNSGRYRSLLTITPTTYGYKVDFHPETAHLTIQLLTQLNKNLPFINKNIAAREALSEEEADLINQKQRELNELDRIHKELLASLAEQQKKWNDNNLEYRNVLEKRITEKETDLEKKFQDKEKVLEDEKVAFQEEKKSFDDRDRTHVRRDLLQNLRTIIKENKTAKLSSETSLKRHPITMLLLLVMTVTFTGAMFLIVHAVIEKRGENIFIYAIPASSCILLFISTAIYYLRWQGQWLKIHVDAELANKKFDTDMLRAGWLAELFFEWDESKKTEFPQQMIDSFTKNLFENEACSKTIAHPIEDVLIPLKVKGIGTEKV